MAQVRCRCGEELDIQPDGPDRIVCPRCAAKIRVRRTQSLGDVDGFIRFSCPCGRRLKVQARGSPTSGKCPDCGRVVPVPNPNSPDAKALANDPNVVTEELSPEDVARLEQWAKEQVARTGGMPAVSAQGGTPPTSGNRIEAGLRVCPRCGKPVHLNATNCRSCGAPVPRRVD
jgi:hypothetical protein